MNYLVNDDIVYLFHFLFQLNCAWIFFFFFVCVWLLSPNLGYNPVVNYCICRISSSENQWVAFCFFYPLSGGIALAGGIEQCR